MSGRASPSHPAGLEAGRQCFERWRSHSEGRPRIPESLWRTAVELAEEFGVHRTAKALRLNYDALKARVVEGRGDRAASARTSPTFVELVPGAPAEAGKCVVEFDDGHGARLCVRLEHAEATVVAALAGALVRGRR